MGSSYTQFRSHGFWTRDAKIEIWLYALAQQVDALHERPPWLRAAGTHWHSQATAGFMGCVDAHLDDIIGDDDERLHALQRLADETAQRLLTEEALTAGVLNSYGLGGGGEFRDDVDRDQIRPVAEAFGALLRGRLGTDQTSSPEL